MERDNPLDPRDDELTEEERLHHALAHASDAEFMKWKNRVNAQGDAAKARREAERQAEEEEIAARNRGSSW